MAGRLEAKCERDIRLNIAAGTKRVDCNSHSKHPPLGHHRQAARLPRAQGGDPRPAIEEAREDAYLRPRLANVPLEYAKRLLDPIPAGAAALLPAPCGGHIQWCRRERDKPLCRNDFLTGYIRLVPKADQV